MKAGENYLTFLMPNNLKRGRISREVFIYLMTELKKKKKKREK